MPENNEVHVNRKQLLQIVEHFDGKPITNEVIREFCNLHKLDYVSVGVIEDWRFQYGSDKRVATFMPAALAVLMKYKPVPELMGEQERMKIIAENEQLSVEMCKLLEENGILYQEIDLVCKNMGSIAQSIFVDAGSRANNMASTMLAFTAKKTYGDPLTVKALGEAYRTEAHAESERQVAKGIGGAGGTL